MSWSVDLIGKPGAVAKSLADRAKQNPCREPEETIRQQVMGALGIALAAFPENQAVKVSAAGSQSGPDADGKSTHNLSVKLEQLYGFIE